MTGVAGFLLAKFVMPGLVPGIHVLAALSKKDVDGRDEPGHDGKPGSQTLMVRSAAARLDPLYRSASPVAASSSAMACAPLTTLMVVMPISRAGFRLTPRSSR